MKREFKFSVRQTGYDSNDTEFLVTEKDAGTAPDINVYQAGQYRGDLTLSQRGAKQLADTLYFILGIPIPKKTDAV